MARNKKQMADAGQKHRETMAERSREESKAASDIAQAFPGLTPEIIERRERYRDDLFLFLTECFPESTGLNPFSDDHKKAIATIQAAITGGGRFINAVYRGFAKTTISENSAIWAGLFGHRKCGVIVGADEDAATGNIESVKAELETNEILFELWPEVCGPIRALEGKVQRCKSQHINGERTRIGWNSTEIVLPSVKVGEKWSDASGFILVARGITGRIRGYKKKLADGTQQRPDFVIIDDPQTDESAASTAGVRKRLNIVAKAILKLAGHTETIAAVMNATVIEPGDLVDTLLDHKKHPEWQGVRVPMVKTWAGGRRSLDDEEEATHAHDTLWMDQYASIRTDYDPEDPNGRLDAIARANEFYRQNQEAMDEGCHVSWAWCFDPETEVSAIQHAYNALIDDGPEVFASEYQNEPDTSESASVLCSVDELLAKEAKTKAWVCPMGTEKIGFHIDVQLRCLYYTVMASTSSFEGRVIATGTFPPQKKPYFEYRKIRTTIQKKYPGLSEEEQRKKALTELLRELLGKVYTTPEGEILEVGVGLVDAGNWADDIREVVYSPEFRTKVFPAFGVGLTKNDRHLLDTKKPSGEVWGSDRQVPWQKRRADGKKYKGRRHVRFDTNRVKTFVHKRFMVPLGGKGGFSLHKAKDHAMLADHICKSEYTHSDKGKEGKIFTSWHLKPAKPDNHLFDTVVGATVALAMQGVSLGGIVAQPRRRKRKRGNVDYL